MQIGRAKRQHFVVTGGAGFIGSHLCSTLLASGAHVTILTRHAASPRAQQLARQGARVLPCDLSRGDGLPALSDLPQGQPFIHLAADVSVNGPGLWAANVDGTKRALDLAGAIQAAHVTVASSIEAQGLGSDEEGPLREEAVCRPVSDYGLSKVKAEEAVAEWQQASGKAVLVLRIGNIYGPGSGWLLEPTLLALLHHPSVQNVWTRLRGRRLQPLYVADLVNGMARAIDEDLTGLYNLTGEETVTIEDYVGRVARLLDVTRELSALGEPASSSSAASPSLPADFAYVLMGDPIHCHRCYDNSKLRDAIGRYARWSLTRGLASTLRWYCATRGLPGLPAMKAA
ncbi:MAG TPA: NAD(P)-dependent oxidoreductase [Nitrospiraceae bacterium]|nr:NAD(P)-dependent oxidoreductase [Nitrospiraceae bacterium]